MYSFGVTGNFGGGLLDAALFQNWIPLWANHSSTFITQIVIGLCFTVIYFFVFRFLIVHFDFKTPGRGEDAGGDKLFTKADYKAQQGQAGGAVGAAMASGDERDIKAAFFLQDLGGKSNIVDVTNCATRLRVTVKDDSKIASVATFTEHGAHGLVHNGRAIQVIVGLSVPQVRERFETLLNSPDVEPVPAAAPAPAPAPTSSVNTSEHVAIKAVVSGKVIDMSEVPDAMFSQKMMGDGVAIEPDEDTIKAPADAEITMVMDDSKHAVGLKFKNGAEMLIHIGIDTVNLKGEGFKLLTKSGAKVKAGDPLVKIDRKVIAKAGYKDVVVMAITNSADFPQMQKETGKKVKATEDTVINF